MDKLPQELVEHIFRHYFSVGSRNDALQLRLVCKSFDRLLKDYACRKVSLTFSRLSKSEIRRRPALDDLQTIGKHCKALNIDLSPVRDELEVSMVTGLPITDPHEIDDPATADFHRHFLRLAPGDNTFTWPEYRDLLDAMLLTCDRIQALQLSLPLPMTTGPCSEPTRALANTFAAFASRLNDEGVEPLRTLVLENLDDQIIQKIWGNPMDIEHIARVMSHLRNLVIVFRARRPNGILIDSPGTVARCFRHMISAASNLESLCIRGLSPPHEPRSVTLKVVPGWEDEDEIADDDETDLGGILMVDMTTNLTRLELSRLELPAKAYRYIARHFGPTLEELYLSELYLWVNLLNEADRPDTSLLWIGVPTLRPASGETWIAVLLRESCPRLRVCRAAFLGYMVNEVPDENYGALLDLHDFSFLGRSVAQRFVEVVLGYAQLDGPPDFEVSSDPNAPARDRRIQYLPADPAHDDRFTGDALRPRPQGGLKAIDHDVNAYHSAVANTTSRWYNNIDTVFPIPVRTAEKREIEDMIAVLGKAVDGNPLTIPVNEKFPYLGLEEQALFNTGEPYDEEWERWGQYDPYGDDFNEDDYGDPEWDGTREDLAMAVQRAGLPPLTAEEEVYFMRNVEELNRRVPDGDIPEEEDDEVIEWSESEEAKASDASVKAQAQGAEGGGDSAGPSSKGV